MSSWSNLELLILFQLFALSGAVDFVLPDQDQQQQRSKGDESLINQNSGFRIQGSGFRGQKILKFCA